MYYHPMNEDEYQMTLSFHAITVMVETLTWPISEALAVHSNRSSTNTPNSHYERVTARRGEGWRGGRGRDETGVVCYSKYSTSYQISTTNLLIFEVNFRALERDHGINNDVKQILREFI